MPEPGAILPKMLGTPGCGPGINRGSHWGWRRLQRLLWVASGGMNNNAVPAISLDLSTKSASGTAVVSTVAISRLPGPTAVTRTCHLAPSIWLASGQLPEPLHFSRMQTAA